VQLEESFITSKHEFSMEIDWNTPLQSGSSFEVIQQTTRRKAFNQ
jgi:hypothetical protein